MASSPNHRGINPFQGVPMPIALDGYNLRASEIFQERPLASHLRLNHKWLQESPRTSYAIHAALYPEYSLGSMEPDDVRAQLNHALWGAGYQPSNVKSSNPTWSWSEDE